MYADKYEFNYKGDSVIADKFFFSGSDQEWILYSRNKYFYSGGHIISRESFNYSNGTVFSYYKSESEYNEQGDVIRSTSESNGTETVTEYEYTYVFDDVGNITERTSFDGVNTRRLVYYYENGGSNIENFNVPISPDSYIVSLSPYTNVFK
jgi:hypothetical protein